MEYLFFVKIKIDGILISFAEKPPEEIMKKRIKDAICECLQDEGIDAEVEVVENVTELE